MIGLCDKCHAEPVVTLPWDTNEQRCARCLNAGLFDLLNKPTRKGPGSMNELRKQRIERLTRAIDKLGDLRHCIGNELIPPHTLTAETKEALWHAFEVCYDLEAKRIVSPATKG